MEHEWKQLVKLTCGELVESTFKYEQAPSQEEVRNIIFESETNLTIFYESLDDWEFLNEASGAMYPVADKMKKWMSGVEFRMCMDSGKCKDYDCTLDTPDEPLIICPKKDIPKEKSKGIHPNRRAEFLKSQEVKETKPKGKKKTGALKASLKSEFSSFEDFQRSLMHGCDFNPQS